MATRTRASAPKAATSKATASKPPAKTPAKPAAPRHSKKQAAVEPFRTALTFDAEHPDRRSTPGVQERLLDILDRLDVKATFFIQGRWAEAYPDTAARIAKSGHLVGNHSHYHARMPHLSRDGLDFDIKTAEE